MKLKYGLVSNELTPDPNDQRAVVYVEQVKTLDDIVDEMIGRGSTITKAEAMSNVEEYHRAIALFLGQGCTVTTPAYSITPVIKGVFENEDDRFNPSKHELYLNIRPNTRLKDAAKNIAVEYVESQGQQPRIKKLYDLVSETTSEQLTPGGIAHLKGKLLKFDVEDAQQGIFFISGNQEVKADPKTVARNMPGELIFMVPATLKKGTCQVEVRTIGYGSKKLKIAKLAPALQVK